MCNYFLAITNLQSNIVTFVKTSCRRETARRFESMKSLKIIGNDTLENDVSPLVFCCNYVSRTVVPFLSETFSVK